MVREAVPDFWTRREVMGVGVEKFEKVLSIWYPPSLISSISRERMLERYLTSLTSTERGSWERAAQTARLLRSLELAGLSFSLDEQEEMVRFGTSSVTVQVSLELSAEAILQAVVEAVVPPAARSVVRAAMEGVTLEVVLRRLFLAHSFHVSQERAGEGSAGASSASGTEEGAVRPAT
jgi:hypothetical protein